MTIITRIFTYEKHRLTCEEARRIRSAERMAFDNGFYGFLGAACAAFVLVVFIALSMLILGVTI